MLALLLLAGVSAAAFALTRTPLPEEDPLLQTTFICASDVIERCAQENSLAQLSGGEDRVSVSYERLPRVLVEAVVATEDRDFFDHSGLDPIGIVRAAWTNLRGAGRGAGGFVDHPAVREERLSHGGAVAAAEDRGGGARRQAGAGAVEGGDPPPLPEHHLLRPWCLRGAGGLPRLLREGRGPARPLRVGVPGRAHPLPGVRRCPAARRRREGARGARCSQVARSPRSSTRCSPRATSPTPRATRPWPGLSRSTSSRGGSPPTSGP